MYWYILLVFPIVFLAILFKDLIHVIKTSVVRSSNTYNKEKEKDNSRVKSFNTHEEQKYGQILDLKGKVSISDIHNAYKKKIREYHPDKVERMGGEIKKLAQKRTKEIIEAYEFFKKKYGV